MTLHENNFEEKNWSNGTPQAYQGTLSRVHIVEFFSKLHVPGSLGSGGHSHTSFRTGEFRGE